MGRDKTPVAAAVSILIKAYQYAVSPLLGPRCRFYPTCSDYALEAIGQYGVARGALLGIWRICRCQPWSKGGYDPVPPLS